MAQAGIHALLGAGVSKWIAKSEWILLGVILGNLLPDADNLAVAVATLAGGETDGLHRTFTHSLFTVGLVVLVFYFLSWITKKARWGNLGLGLGLGILMHIMIDLLVWFDGVEIFWPLPSWVNLWENATPPEWWSNLMMPMEFLFMAFFLVLLSSWSRKTGTDQDYLPKLRLWIFILVALFVVFTILVYVLEAGFMMPFGAVYLLTLGLVIGVVLRMRATIEKVSASAGT